MNRYWVYHPTKESKIVLEDEYYQLLNEGWYNTPADFPNSGDASNRITENQMGLAANSFNNDNEPQVSVRRGRPPKERP